MKIVYIDCAMGAAGDMLISALADTFDDKKKIEDELNNINIPHVRFELVDSYKCGIKGIHTNVYVGDELEEAHDVINQSNHEHLHIHANDSSLVRSSDGHTLEHHHHTSLSDVKNIINGLNVSDKVKSDAIEVYKLLASAESKVHGKEISDIHFHEVGTMDAIGDVAAVCFLFDKIKADKIIVSPINVGKGFVKCAHGTLPVPAPATEELLMGVPIYSGDVTGELCTPTGAALIKYFADEFGNMPIMTTDKIGFGHGQKDFEIANTLRVKVGVFYNEKSDFNKPGAKNLQNSADNDEKFSFSKDNNINIDSKLTDTCIELSCNLDDMTGEEIGYAIELLLKEGAKDVYTTQIGMKKSRPGIKLSCICASNDIDKFVKLIFANTTTIGIRSTEYKRYILDRKSDTITTRFGDVRKKISSGYGTLKEKLEYDDIKKVIENKDRGN